MATFWRQLFEKPSSPRARLNTYTERCGYLYMSLGVFPFVWPEGAVLMGLMTPFQGQEEGLYRLLGLVLFLTGYFYVFGSRAQSAVFGLATVLDRLLVPFAMLFIYCMSSIELVLVLPIAILDPLLGFGAYLCWRRDEAERAAAHQDWNDERHGPQSKMTTG